MSDTEDIRVDKLLETFFVTKLQIVQNAAYSALQKHLKETEVSWQEWSEVE